jgi:hypothetical protein
LSCVTPARSALPREGEGRKFIFSGPPILTDWRGIFKFICSDAKRGKTHRLTPFVYLMQPDGYVYLLVFHPYQLLGHLLFGFKIRQDGKHVPLRPGHPGAIPRPRSMETGVPVLQELGHLHALIRRRRIAAAMAQAWDVSLQRTMSMIFPRL